MSATFDALLPKLREIAYLHSAIAELDWDQQVNMPPKGASGRGEVLAYLSVLSHGKATDPELIAQIATLFDNPADLDEDERAAVRELKRDTDIAVKLPSEYVRELTELTSQAFHIWEKARAVSDFSAFQPYLQKIVELKRKEANYLGFTDSTYDALLDTFEPGLKSARLTDMFSSLREGLTGILSRIPESNKPEIKGKYPQDKQRALCLQILDQLGFDSEAGRLDTSAHPFSTAFNPRDLRITTHFKEDNLFDAIHSTVHEMGHALYEYGLPVERFGTPLAEAASYGVHESQSRGWENCIGRSRPFWKYWFPRLAKAFPEPFSHLSESDVYAAVNAVKHSLIRTEADEVTYNLHIIVRFEIEKALIEGSLEVKDAPTAWNAKMREYLGVDVPDDAHGILQDVHWSGGMFGYFPSYCLGNMYAAQLFSAQKRDIPDMEAQIARGDFAAYREWNRSRIHQFGRRYLPEELIERATGEKPDPRYLLEYLEAKYVI